MEPPPDRTVWLESACPLSYGLSSGTPLPLGATPFWHIRAHRPHGLSKASLTVVAQGKRYRDYGGKVNQRGGCRLTLLQSRTVA